MLRRKKPHRLFQTAPGTIAQHGPCPLRRDAGRLFRQRLAADNKSEPCSARHLLVPRHRLQNEPLGSPRLAMTHAVEIRTSLECVNSQRALPSRRAAKRSAAYGPWRGDGPRCADPASSTYVHEIRGAAYASARWDDRCVSSSLPPAHRFRHSVHRRGLSPMQAICLLNLRAYRGWGAAKSNVPPAFSGASAPKYSSLCLAHPGTGLFEELSCSLEFGVVRPDPRSGSRKKTDRPPGCRTPRNGPGSGMQSAHHQDIRSPPTDPPIRETSIRLTILHFGLMPTTVCDKTSYCLGAGVVRRP